MGKDFAGWSVNMGAAALTTLQIAVGAFALGLTIGLMVALVKMGGRRPFVAVANLYTTICRAAPELLLILLLFYAGGDALNALLGLFGKSVEINGFIAAVFVLGVVQGAYASEIIRGAALAIPVGQIEAARAFGMTPGTILRRVTLPAMAPYALPGLGNLWLSLVKDTTLVSVVGYSELLLTTKQAAGATKQYFFYYLFAAAIYFVICALSSMVFRLIEGRLRRWAPAPGGA